MESKYKVISYGPEIVEDIRKEYNIDNEEKREEAFRIIEEWLLKQDHLLQKTFSRGYLERCLVTCKGSIEKTKLQIDKMCTLRTLLPQYFEKSYLTASDLESTNVIYLGYMPKLTREYYRVFMLKVKANVDVKSSDYFKLNQFFTFVSQFLKNHDYNRGYVTIFDTLDANTTEVLSKINLVEFQQFLPIITEGIGGKIKGVIFLTKSKFIETFIKMLKPFLKEKLRKRIHVATDIDRLKEFIADIDILPVEYGGTEKSLEQLNDDLFKTLNLEPVQELLRESNAARTDESKRQRIIFNDQYMGMPGTFRTMKID